MTLIRTTIEPEREIEVGEVELNDLTRLGLVLPAPTAPRKTVKADD